MNYYVSGSCWQTNGPGGWAVVNEDSTVKQTGSVESAPGNTNNTLEMMAVLKAAELAAPGDTVYSCSQTAVAWARSRYHLLVPVLWMRKIDSPQLLRADRLAKEERITAEQFEVEVEAEVEHEQEFTGGGGDSIASLIERVRRV